jgi:hypothetical protein
VFEILNAGGSYYSTPTTLVNFNGTNGATQSPRMTTRRFPVPWLAEKIAGGYVVRDANGQSLAYIYSRANEAEAIWLQPWPRRSIASPRPDIPVAPSGSPNTRGCARGRASSPRFRHAGAGRRPCPLALREARSPKRPQAPQPGFPARRRATPAPAPRASRRVPPLVLMPATPNSGCVPVGVRYRRRCRRAHRESWRLLLTRSRHSRREKTYSKSSRFFSSSSIRNVAVLLVLPRPLVVFVNSMVA